MTKLKTDIEEWIKIIENDDSKAPPILMHPTAYKEYLKNPDKFWERMLNAFKNML